jgi:hypothetical protein
MTNHNKGKAKEEIFLEKYTPALGRAIAQKVEDGFTIGEICNTLKLEGFPNEKTVYRWKKKYPEFKALLNSAYQDLMYKMLDEQTTLSKALMESTRALKGVTKSEGDAIRLHQTSIKARIQVIQFTLAKIAPKLVNELKDMGNSAALSEMPPINIVMFSEPKPKVIEG